VNNPGVQLKKYLVFFFVLFASVIIKPQGAKFDSLTTQGIKQIYDMQFTQAESTFRRLIADYPDHPAGRFFLAMIDWWKILVDPDVESYDDLFFQKLEDVIFQCDQLLDKNPKNVDALFFKGGAIGFRGRLRAFRESWIKAADDGREALPIVERASNLDPNNLDVQLGFGIYNYYASVIPNEFPLLKPLMIFFPKGDKQKGITQLVNTAMNGKYAKYEARYFLMTLYFNYENDPYKAGEFGKLLITDFPDNPIFERWMGRIAAKKGDYPSCASFFQDVLNKGEKNYFGYNNKKAQREACYYVGVEARNEKKLDTAKTFFQRCADLSRQVDKNEDSGFLINSLLYLGMINDVQGFRDKAKELYTKLLDLKDFANSHMIAKQYLVNPYKE
jgi:tetratricopeptide (TPR) repeat protein